ncbi:MAG: hypothetical protein AB1921_15395 [Thermodesulfobacteriota bacterium]
MSKGSAMEESILKAAKEIVVKFIEVGRVSPASFAETFVNVYQAIQAAVEHKPGPGPVEGEGGKKE